MRVIVDAIRGQDGLPEGTLPALVGQHGVFSGTLHLLGVRGFDLARADAAGPASGDEETHG